MRLSKMRSFMLELAIFLSTVVSVIVLYGNNILLTFLLLSYFLVGVFLIYDKKDLLLYLIWAVAGPTVEIGATGTSVWVYSNPTFFGIPIWLPFAWGSTAMIIKKSMVFSKLQ